MKSDLPKYASNNRTQGTPAEYKDTAEGNISYFGTYTVSGTDLILHVEGSTFPNWIGTDQKRVNLSLTGDDLKATNTFDSPTRVKPSSLEKPVTTNGKTIFEFPPRSYTALRWTV